MKKLLFIFLLNVIIVNAQDDRRAASQQYYNRLSEMSARFDNSMNKLMSAVMSTANDTRFLNARVSTAKNYVQKNHDKISSLMKIYQKIKKFSSLNDGLYNAYIINEKQISTLELQKFPIVNDCLVEIKSSHPVAIYPFGKEEMKITLDEDVILENGVFGFTDMNNLSVVDVLIIEPYINKNFSEPKVVSNKVSQILLFSDDKDTHGKPAYVQELDSNGSIINETKTIINYAKRDKDIEFTPQNSFFVNSGTTLKIYSEPFNHSQLGIVNFIGNVANRDLKETKDMEQRKIEVSTIDRKIEKGYMLIRR